MKYFYHIVYFAPAKNLWGHACIDQFQEITTWESIKRITDAVEAMNSFKKDSVILIGFQLLRTEEIQK